jgi:LytS/YehU family sensor histidine kinase
MEYDRTNVLLTQISSHFFYHTLNAIQALIVLDPDAAYRMTEDFFAFLRFKVDSVSAENGLVPFREELRSVFRLRGDQPRSARGPSHNGI